MSFLKDFFGAGGGAETQSVILLRQVPIRYDEPARSWLGGLPQMPDEVAWPRTEAGAPLQFVAQVCCADLPKEMWGGIGPRDGWLLLFVDCYSMEEENEGGNVQVLHLRDRGPEREPPKDMGTYRNAMVDSIDSIRPVIRPGLPKMWRRWPVDVIVQEVPSPEKHDGETVWAPRPVDAETLYGAPAQRGFLRLTVADGARPLTWRGVLQVLDGLVKAMETDLRAAQKGEVTPQVVEPGFVAGVMAKARDRLADLQRQLAENEAQLVVRRAEAPADLAAIEARFQGAFQRLRAQIADYERNLAELAPYSGFGRDVMFAAEVNEAQQAHRAWVLAQARLLAELRAEVLGQDLDAALPQADWEAIRARLTAARTVNWYVNTQLQTASRVEADLLSRHPKALEFALREDVLDLYARDAKGRDMIPPALLAELEPMLRSIGCGQAPHRMGGPHDVIQEPDFPSQMRMLFQIYSDYPLGWMWADVGALFVHISARDLKAGRFDAIEARMDGG